MVEAISKTPTSLTKHGIRTIVESDNIATDLENVEIVLQVTDVTVFDEKSAKKNIRARVHVSDGVSKMICLITTKIFGQIVSIYASWNTSLWHIGASHVDSEAELVVGAAKNSTSEDLRGF